MIIQIKLAAISKKLKDGIDVDVAEKALELCKGHREQYEQSCLSLNKEILKATETALRAKVGNAHRWGDLRIKALLFDAQTCFDSFCQYLEIDRPRSSRFYAPRRKVLMRHGVVQAFQALADDELDELFLSMPPRTGKTQITTFFLLWIMGRNSEKSNLYSSYNDDNCKAFYTGLNEVLGDRDTYRYYSVFPNTKLVHTDAKAGLLNLDRKKKYATITCRSRDGGLNGSCDCDGFMFADDMLNGIEEAISPGRLRSSWLKVDNNLLTRAKPKAKIVWTGTRWSIVDPIGMRQDIIKNEPKFKGRRVKEINIPALDENDESNFDYGDIDDSFPTIYYQQRRAGFERNNDMASWCAQYMGEPIERDGTVFCPDDMLFFNGVLPEGEPTRIFTGIDPAWGGGDFVSAPFCFQYEDKVYVPDVVYNNGNKKITQPEIANRVIRHKAQAARFEANKMTESYKEGVESILKEKEYKLNIETKSAPNKIGKQQRIFDKAPDIRGFYFLEDGKRNKEYQMFMQNVFSFKVIGKNKNDDAPDSLAICVDMMSVPVSNKVSVFKRPF